MPRRRGAGGLGDGVKPLADRVSRAFLLEPKPDQRQVTRSRLTAAGRAAYELEARALAQAIVTAQPFPDATAHDRAVALARLVLRLTDHRDGANVEER